MSIEEAIRRLVDVAKTLKPDSNTYIAFRMAVEALWAQERQEDDGKYLIDRQAAIDAANAWFQVYVNRSMSKVMSIQDILRNLPSAQPEVTLESAIEYLHSIGWMQKHDKEITESSYSEGYTVAESKYRKMWDEMPKIIQCKDCKHKPHPSDKYNYDNGDCGFEIIFPDYRCPCRCDDEYYNRIPDDDWYCGNAERRTDE